MKKDIIYIDVEDDITEIISKIKAGKEKIVALVPPKRVGVLQSAVNLRLLNRSAETAHKRLVLITANPALVALSANIGIPVAKNLQSKPELPEVDALDVDEGEDVIDGGELPVGEHAKSVKTAGAVAAGAVAGKAVDDAIETIKIDDHSIDADETESAESVSEQAKAKKSKKSGVSVPNFDKFRKRLFLGIGAGVLLIALLIWAFVFAPSAKVIVTTRTNPLVVSVPVTLGGTESTDTEKGLISSEVQTLKKEQKVEFDVTGTKTVGDAASGSVVFENCETFTAQNIPAGTIISNGGQSYETEAAVVVPGGSGSFLACTNPGISSAVPVTATDIGSDYNASSGTSFIVDGHASGSSAYLRATAEGAIDGGSSKEVKVATDADVRDATAKLSEESSDGAKAELIAQFTNGQIVIDESFNVSTSSPVSSPAVGAEASDGKATLTVTSTYTITGLAREQVQAFLKKNIDQQLENRDNQRAYDDGIDDVRANNYRKDGDTETVTLVTTAQIGPNVDEAQVREAVRGKIYGDAQAALESIDGVSSVDVQFSYFWVRTVPSDDAKITVEFASDNGE